MCKCFVFYYWWSRYIHWIKKNGNKYLVFATTDKNKELLIIYTELWNKIKNLTKTKDDKPVENGTDLTKIKFDSDDNLPLKNAKAS